MPRCTVHRLCKEVKITLSVCVCVLKYICRAVPVALGERKRRQQNMLIAQKTIVNMKELTLRENEFMYPQVCSFHLFQFFNEYC